MRRFKLSNERNEIFDLMDEKSFFHQPQGLGLKKVTEYAKFNLVQFAVKENIEFPSIDGEILFSTYEDYHKFVNYIFSSKDLQLLYSPSSDIGEYNINIDVSNISKGEVDKNLRLIKSQVEFVGKSFFKKATKFSTIKESDNSATEECYPYTYPFTYAEGGGGQHISFYLSNKGHTPAPINIKIEGISNAPEWYIERYPLESGGLNLMIQKGEEVNIDSREDVYKITGNGGIILDDYKKHELKNYIYAPIGSSKLIITNTEKAEVTIYEQFISI